MTFEKTALLEKFTFQPPLNVNLGLCCNSENAFGGPVGWFEVVGCGNCAWVNWHVLAIETNIIQYTIKERE
jgi:hypothetical protein